MNTASASAPSAAPTPASKTFVDTVIELGSSWAAFGLNVGKTALVQSAETLGKIAHALDTLAAAIKKKATEAKSEPAPKDQAAEPAAAKSETANL